MTEPVDSLAELIDRLHDATEQERHALFAAAATDAAGGARIEEAAFVLGAARRTVGRSYPSDAETNDPDHDDDTLALALARGRIPRSAVDDPVCVRWLLASLVPARPDVSSAPGAASARARRAMQKLAHPARARHPRPWFLSLGLAAAVTAGAVVLLTPPSEDWARDLDLSRLRIWRMSSDLTASVRQSHDTGQLSVALFERQAAGTRRQRSPATLGVDPPVPLYPRWEAVAEGRPAFRWTGAGTAFEVLVVDDQRNLVWSARSDTGAKLAYPADQPPLEPGKTYYWKVNRLGSDRLVASSYVGLRALDGEARQRLSSDLRAAGRHPFVRGVAYDRLGLYTSAAAAFAEADGDGSVAARAAVRAKQGLGP